MEVSKSYYKKTWNQEYICGIFLYCIYNFVVCLTWLALGLFWNAFLFSLSFWGFGDFWLDWKEGRRDLFLFFAFAFETLFWVLLSLSLSLYVI